MCDLLCSISFPESLTRGAGLCLAARECQGGPGQGGTAATCLLSPPSLPWCFTHQLPQSLRVMALASLCSLRSLTQGSFKYVETEKKRKERTRLRQEVTTVPRAGEEGTQVPITLSWAPLSRQLGPSPTAFPPHPAAPKPLPRLLCPRQGQQAPAEQSGPQSSGCSGRSRAKLLQGLFEARRRSEQTASRLPTGQERRHTGRGARKSQGAGKQPCARAVAGDQEGRAGWAAPYLGPVALLGHHLRLLLQQGSRELLFALLPLPSSFSCCSASHACSCRSIATWAPRGKSPWTGHGQDPASDLEGQPGFPHWSISTEHQCPRGKDACGPGEVMCVVICTL